MKTLVIIPTYNEAENVQSIVPEVLKQHESVDVLIVDDNSPDGTSNLVKELQIDNNRVKLIERRGKLGLGSAYVCGFKYAIRNEYDYIFEMDADFSHDPNSIVEMLSLAQKYDLVIGSRYCEGINVVNWPLRRLILSYFASLYVQVITGMTIKDPTGGFKCFSRKVLENINLNGILSDGYSFQVEINYRVWLRKFRIKEFPIVFTDRRVGKSKMSKKIIREAVWMVWKLRLLAFMKRIP